jgi:hypothetical protein
MLVGAAGALTAYVADTLATWLVLGWSRVRMRFAEVAAIRGVTYFLAIVNYSFGQAAMILVLSRHGVRGARAAGVVLLIMGINVLVLLGFASVSIATGAAAPPALRTAILVIAGSLPLYLALLLWRPPWLAGREVFAPLFDLGPLGHLKAVAARLPHVASMLATNWLMMRCFAIQVPALIGALYLPIVFAVAVMPISAQGLGTSQLLAIQFFAPYAAGNEDAQRAAVLAYSLYTIATWVPTQILIGLLSLRTEHGRAIRAATEAAKASGLTEGAQT